MGGAEKEIRLMQREMDLAGGTGKRRDQDRGKEGCAWRIRVEDDTEG